MRYVKLAQILAGDNRLVYTFGLEQIEFNNENIKKCENINKVIQNCKIILGPLPFSKDGKSIIALFSRKTIYIEDILKSLNNTNIFITGKIEPQYRNLLTKQAVLFIDLLEREELTVLNAVATCEGAIKTAIEKTSVTLHESNCLVLGFGRIGKLLCKMLDGIGAKVYAEARKNSDIAWIRAYGYNPIKLEELNENLSNQDIIFNTVPNLILNEERLKLLKKDCLIVDLASSPGGVDFEKAKELGINTILDLGIPGKTSPNTAAKYIFDTIQNIEKEIF